LSCKHRSQSPSCRGAGPAARRRKCAGGASAIFCDRFQHHHPADLGETVGGGSLFGVVRASSRTDQTQNINDGIKFPSGDGAAKERALLARFSEFERCLKKQSDRLVEDQRVPRSRPTGGRRISSSHDSGAPLADERLVMMNSTAANLWPRVRHSVRMRQGTCSVRHGARPRQRRSRPRR
jgi:hypothetical protein